MKKITEKELYDQSSLTQEKIKKYLTPSSLFKPKKTRPESSLVDLINWVADELLLDEIEYGSYIHNKIIVDGAFLHFCEETKTNVSCIVKDSIASWNTNYGTEQFIAQGIFKISRNDFEFYQCSLFHKGTQNEDEVSFFVIVSHKHFEKYIKLRNEYEAWQNEREKSSQDIYVVGGEPISYDTGLSWSDLILSEDAKLDIKTSVEGFLNAESLYKKRNIPWKRGLIFFGDPGCGKTQCIKILLSEYGFKPVTIYSGHPQKDQLLKEAFEYAEDHGPALLLLEDFPELMEQMNVSHFLQLLDGVKTTQGLLIIGTANDLSDVPPNITDRPSRFDRKFHFPNPNEETALSYLKSLFGKSLNKNQYSYIVKEAIKNNFSFAYLKEIFVTSMHIAIADNRDRQNYNDVEKAIQCLAKDKGYIQTGFGLGKVMDMSSFLEE